MITLLLVLSVAAILKGVAWIVEGLYEWLHSGLRFLRGMYRVVGG